VIISLENFCNKEQQLILANYMKDILKDIFTINSNKLPEKYPSPKDLQGKFIIKEIKTLKILRQSSLPAVNLGTIIQKSINDINLSSDVIDSSSISKNISNSFSQTIIKNNKDVVVDEELMHIINFYNIDLPTKHEEEEEFDYEAFEDLRNNNNNNNKIHLKNCV